MLDILFWYVGIGLFVVGIMILFPVLEFEGKLCTFDELIDISIDVLEKKKSKKAPKRLKPALIIFMIFEEMLTWPLTIPSIVDGIVKNLTKNRK